MISRKRKWASPLFIVFLAVASVFGISSGLINKQVNEQPVVEKANAIYGGTIWFTRPDGNEYTDTGINPWVYIEWTDGGKSNNGMSSAFTNWDNCGVFTYTIPSNVNQWQVHYKEKGDNEKWSDFWQEPGAINQGLYHSGWVYAGSSQFHMSKWTVRTVTFTYDGNGNDGGSTSNTTNFYPDNKDATLATNGFWKVGYKFNGWNTKADGTGYSFSSGGKLVRDYAMDTETLYDGATITLYAQWTTEGAQGILWEKTSGKNFNNVHIWGDDSGTTWPGYGGSAVTIGGKSFMYVDLNNINFTPHSCIFNDGNSGEGHQTGTHSTAGHLDGNSFYRISDTAGEDWTWFNFSRSMSYLDEGGGDYSGNNSSSLPSYASYTSDTELPDGTKNGYDFDGWYLTSDCSDDSIDTIYAGGYYTSTEPIEVYAKWTAATYTVSFNNGGGTGGSISVSSYTFKPSGTSTITITTPIKAGYSPAYTITRTGDYGGTAPSISGTTVTIPAGSYGTFTIGTTWNGNSYSVSFDNGDGTGGSVNKASYNTSTNSQTLTITAPTRVGYNTPTYTITRTGTYGGTAPSISGTTVTIPANSYGAFTITTTGWTPNTNTAYTVKHYKQNIDGTYPSTPTDTDNLTGTTGASVTPARKSYTGFTAPAGQTVTILADGSRVVNYQYTRNSYTLTWDGNGGTLDDEDTITSSVKYGDTITEPSTKEREGYTFTGWDTTPASTMPASATTYTAQWSINSYNLTLTISDGIGTIYYKIGDAENYSSTTSTKTISITYGVEYYLYATKANDGYILNSPYDGYTDEDPYSAIKAASAETWAPTATSGETAAISFATTFNTNIGGICKNDGVSTNLDDLSSEWGKQASAYSGLADYIKYWFNEKGGTASSDSNVTNMIAKYKYVYGKYSSGVGTDFLSGKLNAYSAINNVPHHSLFGNDENDLTSIIIIVSSSIALVSITGLSILVLKKRKEKVD